MRDWRVMLRMWAAGALLVALMAACGTGDDARPVASVIGDAPALAGHTAQAAIESGELALDEIVSRGEALFAASFNTLDGAGRPETTDTSRSNFREPRVFPQNFNRISGPDANACSACHSLPRRGGGGDNSTNVFVLADRLPFVNFDGGEGDGQQLHTLTSVGDERNAVGIFGAGYIELLAREMTVELQQTASEAVKQARSSGASVSSELVAKGVSFGTVTARPNGTIDTSDVEGVDSDLIIKPFMQKGAIVSLREFGVKAMNQHFGMQAVERFQDGVDADRDGVVDELTRGDITALVLYQATLPVPGRSLPAQPEAQLAAKRGSELFATLRCAVCHVPALRLDSPVFTEPNPFNPPDKLQVADVSNPFAVDLTQHGGLPRLSPAADGSVMVPVFTDLKRHSMGDVLDNESLEQEGIATEQWLTRKLWGFAGEPPYLHHGRATLISEAIMAHGGESQESRDAYAALPPDDQAAVVEFLKTLQVLPEGTADLIATAGTTESEGLTKWAAIGGGAGGATLLLVAALAVVLWRKRRRGASSP